MFGTMPLISLALILLSVSMSAMAQLALKMGMSAPSLKATMAIGSPGQILAQIFLSPFVVGGLLVYFLGAVVWLLVLSKIPLSQAYPFVGLGFILTMVLSFLVLGETVSTLRVAGTFLVVAGVIMIAFS